MKTKITFIIALFIVTTSLAQNVTITPNGITPLQGGGALQKLTYTAIKALPNPQPGDQAYDLTYNCMRFYNGVRWVDSQSSPNAIEPNITGFRASDNFSDVKIAVDAAGNTYMAGDFISTKTFGTTTLASAGFDDIFVAKYLPNGTLSYVVKAGGIGADNFIDMGIDSNNDIYVTGYFFGVSTTFGGITANNSDANGNTFDIFTAKFTGSTGAVSWLKTGGNPGNNDFPSALTLDASNNVYIGANFRETATFSNNSITSTGGLDALIIRYSSTGTLNLLQKGGGTNDESVEDIAIAPDGSIFITGSFAGNTTTFSSLIATRVGGRDMYLARYNTISSSWVDLRTAGGPNPASGFSTICTGQTLLIANNNLYVAGIFTNTVEFGSANDQITAKSGKQEMFLASYSLIGTPTLVLQSNSNALLSFGGGSDGDFINDVSFINGAIYICGTNTFNAQALSYLTQNSDSGIFPNKKGFIIKCEPRIFNSFWIKEIRSENTSAANLNTNIINIAKGLNNSIIVCGINFGNIILGGKNIQFGTFLATLEE
jgi:hypothetical protein